MIQAIQRSSISSNGSASRAQKKGPAGPFLSFSRPFLHQINVGAAFSGGSVKLEPFDDFSSGLTLFGFCSLKLVSLACDQYS